MNNENEILGMYCAMPHMPYACRPDRTRGRQYDEPESTSRTPFARDRDRIIHSSAFRRLKNKTQVFVSHEGDLFRTRLTHTLEVAQIARSLARALQANEDLAETVALAHDLGHTPFAHIGEDALSECMEIYGGFNHNDQSLRILTVLEQKYPDWDGLNLTWETLEGVVKHNGPVIHEPEWTLARFLPQLDLEIHTYASLEAQIAALSDDIAYNNHDVEDGLREGYFSLEELESNIPFAADIIKETRKKWPDLPQDRFISEIIREMIGAMVVDVLQETKRRLKKIDPRSPEDVRNAGMALVSFSSKMQEREQELRDFLMTRVYRHYTLLRVRHKVSSLVSDLFGAFMDGVELLPDDWQKRLIDNNGLSDDFMRARTVSDYIAGMTDRYALIEHKRLFDLYQGLR